MVESGVVAWGITDEAVIEVMGLVPRHEFVPEEYLSSAYENHPLPIGYGQTISQPFIVALMSDLAGPEPDPAVAVHPHFAPGVSIGLAYNQVTCHRIDFSALVPEHYSRRNADAAHHDRSPGEL